MNKALALLRRLLADGLSPERLAAALVAALLCGTFPVLGSTTILTTLTALSLRLNLPLMQTVNYLVYPIQLALYVPLLSLGAAWLDPAVANLTWPQLRDLFTRDLGGAIRLLFWANLGAVALWAAAALPLAALTYPALRAVMRNLHRKHPASS